MSYDWKRNPHDITLHAKRQNLCHLLLKREQGHFSKNSFSYIQECYYNFFKDTTPRYIVISNEGNKYDTCEFKFHPNCHNGC